VPKLRNLVDVVMRSGVPVESPQPLEGEPGADGASGVPRGRTEGGSLTWVTGGARWPAWRAADCQVEPCGCAGGKLATSWNLLRLAT
jgi:hypothetical protein